MRRDLEQAKRLELGLVKVRWLLIAYALVQTMVERVDPNAPSYAFELGLVLTLGMLLSNLFFTSSFFSIRMQDGHLYGSLIDILRFGAPLTMVALGMTIPLRGRKDPESSPLESLERDLHPTVAYAILPLFAFSATSSSDSL